MHPYATDSHERRNVILGVALLSVVFAYTLHRGVEWVSIQLPWWVDSPSVMGFFGLLYEAFDKRLWRATPLQGIGIVKVPDLNGTWDVEGRTSFDNGKRFQAQVVIKQTWTAMSIVLESESSISRSLSASLLVGQPEGPTLSYEYRNDPKPDALPTMHSHRGTTVLRRKSTGLLEGEYYSGRDRLNYGSLTLKRRN